MEIVGIVTTSTSLSTLRRRMWPGNTADRRNGQEPSTFAARGEPDPTGIYSVFGTLTRECRFYHAARLRWNSIERRRGPVEDSLIDDIVEWSMWHYSSVREAAQSVLESLCTVSASLLLRAAKPDEFPDLRWCQKTSLASPPIRTRPRNR
jgi:hypothetical protein